MLPIHPDELRVMPAEERRALRERLYGPRPRFASLNNQEQRRFFIAELEAPEEPEAAIKIEEAQFQELKTIYNASNSDKKRKVLTVQEEVCAKHNYTFAQLQSMDRYKPLLEARYELMYRWATECPHMSYPEIARRLSFKDHSSIWYGIRRHALRQKLPVPSRVKGGRPLVDDPWQVSVSKKEEKACMLYLDDAVKGTWVVVTRGRARGRIGVLTGDRVDYHAEVQLGADGPFKHINITSMRKAQDDEIPGGVNHVGARTD